MKLLPCIPYVIPLVDILYHLMRTRPALERLRFHVLGDSDWKNLLDHALLEEHVRATYGIDLVFTYDSSNLFKTVGKGNHTFIINRGNVEKLSLLQDGLARIQGERTIEEHFCSAVNAVVEPFGIRTLNKTDNPIWVDGEKTRLTYLYAFLGQFALYREIERRCADVAHELYPLYQAGDIDSFERAVQREVARLHSGFYAKNVPQRAAIITHSMKVLERLDPDEGTELVDLLAHTEPAKFRRERRGRVA